MYYTLCAYFDNLAIFSFFLIFGHSKPVRGSTVVDTVRMPTILIEVVRLMLYPMLNKIKKKENVKTVGSSSHWNMRPRFVPQYKNFLTNTGDSLGQRSYRGEIVFYSMQNKILVACLNSTEKIIRASSPKYTQRCVPGYRWNYQRFCENET